MVEIRNPEQFSAWLKDRPREWVQVIAMRMAMRVIPFLWSPRSHERSTLFVFRAVFISWAARRYPAQDMTGVAYAAAGAAAAAAYAAYAAPYDPAAYGTAIASVYDTASYAAALAAINAAATAATDIASHAASTATDAIAAAAAATTAAVVWGSVEADVDWLLRQTDGTAKDQASLLALQSLWLEGVSDFARDAWGNFQKEFAGSFWVTWTDWYARRLADSSSGFGLPHGIEERLVVGLAQETNGFWDRDPEMVNEEITKRVAAARFEHATGQRQQVDWEYQSIDNERTLPDEKLLPQQNTKADIFEEDANGRIAPGGLLPERQLLDTPHCRGLFEEFCDAFDSLKSLPANSLGPIGKLTDKVAAVLSVDITTVNPDRLWPRMNALRRALAKHNAAIQSEDSLYDRLDPQIAEDVRAVVHNYNIMVMSQPILAEKDRQAQGPLDIEVERRVFANVKTFTTEVAENECITTPEAAEIVLDAAEAAVSESKDPLSNLGREEGQKINGNFVFKALSVVRGVAAYSFKEVTAGALREVGKELLDKTVQNAGPIAELVAHQAPDCVDAVKSLIEAISDSPWL